MVKGWFVPNSHPQVQRYILHGKIGSFMEYLFFWCYYKAFPLEWQVKEVYNDVLIILGKAYQEVTLYPFQLDKSQTLPQGFSLIDLYKIMDTCSLVKNAARYDTQKIIFLRRVLIWNPFESCRLGMLLRKFSRSSQDMLKHHARES